MKKCKNDECNRILENEKNTYCSLRCATISINKTRDYTKYSETQANKKKLREIKYYENPKLCKNCKEVILFSKLKNNFCSHSCSAAHNNLHRVCKPFNVDVERCRKMARNNFHKDYIELIDEYKKAPKLCMFCKKEIQYCKRHHNHCSRICSQKSIRATKTELENYRRDCQFNFNLKDFEYEYDFKLIEQYGWYKPTNRGNNLKGVSRDHMISINYGFKNNTALYSIISFWTFLCRRRNDKINHLCFRSSNHITIVIKYNVFGV